MTEKIIEIKKEKDHTVYLVERGGEYIARIVSRVEETMEKVTPHYVEA